MNDEKTAFERFDEGEISYGTYKVLAADEEYERSHGDD
ncbi:hypothetical protein M2272_005895 [Mycobacterium frederiksbergense]|uniref:Uncharacterized protein n=1 Tax=Mycolicibacterium frederiksbergense TaxID=117567 RepID=A0ABT6L8E7_9MYCO|nr:hypothetical protein [Mycolicibacterium frederiksbergense]